MANHTYTGYFSIGFEVDSDVELDRTDLLSAIAKQIAKEGTWSGDVGDVEHYIDGVEQDDEVEEG